MQKEQIKLLNSRKTALDGEYYLTALHGEYAGQPSGNRAITNELGIPANQILVDHNWEIPKSLAKMWNLFNIQWSY